MQIQNKFINISGTEWGVGSMQTASVCLLVAQSGAVYIPLQVSDKGYLVTVSGVL